MVRVTQGIFGLKKNLLVEYFNDCPALVKKIRSGDFKEPYITLLSSTISKAMVMDLSPNI
jgi:hypothetical protein